MGCHGRSKVAVVARSRQGIAESAVLDAASLNLLPASNSRAGSSAPLKSGTLNRTVHQGIAEIGPTEIGRENCRVRIEPRRSRRRSWHRGGGPRQGTEGQGWPLKISALIVRCSRPVLEQALPSTPAAVLEIQSARQTQPTGPGRSSQLQGAACRFAILFISHHRLTLTRNGSIPHPFPARRVLSSPPASRLPSTDDRRPATPQPAGPAAGA